MTNEPKFDKPKDYIPLPSNPDLLTLADVLPMISDMDALREIVCGKDDE